MRQIRILSALCAVLLLLSGCKSGDYGRHEVRVAYYSKEGELFGYESREVIAYNDERLCTLALQLAMSEPFSEQLSCIFPERTLLRSVEISGHGVVTVDLSREYSTLPDMKRTIADYCLMLTIYGLQDQLSFSITGVVITVEDEDSRTLRTPNALISGADWLRLKEHTLTIYFPMETEYSLQANSFRRTISEAEEPAEEIMRILLAGQRENGSTVSVVPAGAKLLGVEIHNRVCYLNWNESMIQLSTDTAEQQSLRLYAIINSVCTLPYIDKVQFLINGEAVESPIFKDFDTPYSPNSDLNHR